MLKAHGMIIIRYVNFLPVVFFFIFNSYSFGQTKHDSLQEKLKNAAKEIMISAGTCALITIDHKGVPRVRTMDPFDPEGDFSVWLGTNPNSRKVLQIKQNPLVTLYYLDHNQTGYVTIHGHASIIDDPEMKDVWWKKEWEEFYPDKKHGYVLIQIRPKWMEVVSESRGIVGDSITWQPHKMIFNNK